MTGLVLGGTMALLGFIFASQYVLKVDAAVVAGTVALVVTFGTVNGTLLPIALKRLGFDPALMSNPLIASLSDIVGVLIYFNLALFVLGKR
jgi:magnesium transporter